MNGLYPGPATAPGCNDFSGNPVGPGTATRVGLKSGAPGEVNHGRSEGIGLRRRVVLGDRLDARWAADPDVRQLRRVVDAQVVGETLIRGVEQEIPHLLGLARMIRVRRVSRVNRKPNGLVAEVHLDGAFLGQMARRQQAI